MTRFRAARHGLRTLGGKVLRPTAGSAAVPRSRRVASFALLLLSLGLLCGGCCFPAPWAYVSTQTAPGAPTDRRTQRFFVEVPPGSSIRTKQVAQVLAQEMALAAYPLVTDYRQATVFVSVRPDLHQSSSQGGVPIPTLSTTKGAVGGTQFKSQTMGTAWVPYSSTKLHYVYLVTMYQYVSRPPYPAARDPIWSGYISLESPIDREKEQRALRMIVRQFGYPDVRGRYRLRELE